MAGSGWLRSLRNEGMQASNPRVYGCIARPKISSAEPISTMLPAYITATRCAKLATTARSCDTSNTASPSFWRNCANSSNICP